MPAVAEMRYVPDVDFDAALIRIHSRLWKALGKDEADLIIDDIAEFTLQRYFDGRNDLPNQLYIKKEIVRLLDFIIKLAVIAGKLDYRRLVDLGNSIGIIMIDADYLKAINSYFDYEQGTLLLYLISQKINPEFNPSLRAILKKYGLGYLTGVYGADEFVLLVTPLDWDHNINLANHDYIMEEIFLTIQTSVEEINLTEVFQIDFDKLSEKVGERFYLNSPWLASAPGAYMTFDLAYLIRQIDFDPDYDLKTVLEKVMGKIVDMVGAAAKVAKDEVKQARRESDNPDDQLLAMILGRGEEGQQLIRENIELKKEIKRLNLEKAALQKLLRFATERNIGDTTLNLLAIHLAEALSK
ncbi:hypothetical protein HGA64_05125 [Candidatus Falkowbacteria bacterium]|nr:hypothetical protein [Candidatus Falkowbacteria bacterium]